MAGTIFYFTGTGNSLAIARTLADRLSIRLVNIASLNDMQIVVPEAGILGIVAPVYHGTLPLIVARFVDKLSSLESKYIFAVCTHGDHPGLYMEYMQARLAARGGRLSAGFSLHMPYNYVTPPARLKDFYNSFGLREIDPVLQQALLDKADEKTEKIAAAIQSGQTGVLEIDSVFITRLVDALNLHESMGKSTWSKITGLNEPPPLTFDEVRLRMDKAFTVDEACQGCGTCEKICPVGDIHMVSGRPEWLHHCEQCFACLQWCPNQAIQFRTNTTGQRRYHHPRVSLQDMIS